MEDIQGLNGRLLDSPKDVQLEGQSANVFKPENIRNSKPMNKNANLPKFLIRIFIKYL
jgi:hypothetical protein